MEQEKYNSNLKEAIKKWNEKNPNLRKKTMQSISDELGVKNTYLSILGKRFTKKINIHFDVIYNSEDKEVIKNTWELYQQKNIILINRLEKIRVILECEIWDLICKTSK